MSKLQPLLALLLFIPFFLHAQTRQISGTVTDDKGQPASNVTVSVKGGRSAQTDASGHFSIPITGSGNVTVTLSSIGFKPITITADDKQELTVQLERDAATLAEVVIGYQTVPRSKVSGSVSSLAGRQIKDVPLSSAAEALQGRLAGVQVTASEGAPGSDIIVRVRGGGSITQDNSPLYIVDGVQVENALSVISPQDIASIDVLKDASTTAIYGARAANGVVIITTKGGRSGKTQISYNGSFGWRELPQYMDVMNPYDFVRWQYERSRGNRDDSISFVNTYGRTWDSVERFKEFPMINWQKEVFGRDAKFSNQNVSLNGGNDNTQYNLSLTANKEDGIQIESGFDRYLVNFKLDHKASDKLKIGFNARYLDQTIRGSGTTNSGTRATNRMRHAINYRPFELPTAAGGIDDFDEAYFLASSGAINPVLLTKAEYRKQFTKATYLSGFFNYTIVKNLTFRSTFGYDNGVVETDQFFSKITSTARNFASLPTASIGEQ